jgi:hypothetical protein
MLEILRYGVIFAFCVSVLALCHLTIKTILFNKKPVYAKSRNRAIKGVVYALGRGMMPWEKESAGKHLLTYLGGIFYHTGIFAGLLYLCMVIVAVHLEPIIVSILRVIMFAALFCGLGLFLKRSLKKQLRRISCLDDFASNLIVDVFLVLSLLDTYTIRSRFFLYAVAMVMFLYMPIGKIRHCFFFFYSRILFGLFYGRRGVLPQNKGHFGAQNE